MNHLIPRSRLIARLLFGIDFEPVGPNDYYFDVTTLVLLERAVRALDRSSQVLDMGTGSMAVLALSLWKRLGCRIVASDVDPTLVDLARRNVRRNRAPIPVLHSRYFDEVAGDFDVVLFNPPYVPTEVGKQRALSVARSSQWDGGRTGREVIAGYLEAVGALKREVTTIMGMNYRHVPIHEFRSLLTPFPHVQLEGAYRHPALPVAVYTLRSVPAGIGVGR